MRGTGHRMRRRAQGPAQLSFCRHEGAKTEAKRQGQVSTWGRTAWLAAENGFKAGADKPQPAGPSVCVLSGSALTPRSGAQRWIPWPTRTDDLLPSPVQGSLAHP